MDIEEFTRTINNGLGRAIVWLRDHPWPPYAEAIRNVCLHNTAYDAQCEGSRAEYVYDIIGLTDAPGQFAEVTAKGLLASKDFWDTSHLYHLARLLAQSGNAVTREAMYAKFKQDDAEEHFIGADQLIRLDGMAGLLFVLKQIGQWTQAHPDYWEDDRLLREAQEVLGDDVMPAVARAAQTNPDIASYMAAVEKWKRECGDRPPTPKWEHFAYAELRQQIVEKPSAVPRFLPSVWGRKAPEESLRQAAADLLAENDPQRLVPYLRIFDRRAFPLGPQRLVELATAENASIAHAARRALRHVQHDSVRALAMMLIEQGKADGDVVRLLVRNYAAGDEMVIESPLVAQTDEEDLHWMCHAAVEVFESNEDAKALPVLLQVYERCRCSICRNAAVRVLMKRHVMPECMSEECRYDSNEDTRKLVAQCSKSSSS